MDQSRQDTKFAHKQKRVHFEMLTQTMNLPAIGQKEIIKVHDDAKSKWFSYFFANSGFFFLEKYSLAATSSAL